MAAPTMAAALDGRFLSGLKEERVAAAKFYKDNYGVQEPGPNPVRSAAAGQVDCKSLCPNLCALDVMKQLMFRLSKLLYPDPVLSACREASLLSSKRACS